MNNKLKKISALVKSNDSEKICLGLIILGSSFSKEEIVNSLVSIQNVAKANNKNLEYILDLRSRCPFGLIGSGGHAIRVIFNNFVLNMGWGPYIIYSDENIDSHHYKYMNDVEGFPGKVVKI